MIQPYFAAYLKHHPGYTKDNFVAADYMIWIMRKHREFSKSRGIPECILYNEEEEKEFIKYINKIEEMES